MTWDEANKRSKGDTFKTNKSLNFGCGIIPCDQLLSLEGCFSELVPSHLPTSDPRFKFASFKVLDGDFTGEIITLDGNELRNDINAIEP